MLTCSDVRRSAVENTIAGLNGLRSEGAKMLLSLNDQSSNVDALPL